MAVMAWLVEFAFECYVSSYVLSYVLGVYPVLTLGPI